MLSGNRLPNDLCLWLIGSVSLISGLFFSLLLTRYLSGLGLPGYAPPEIVVLGLDKKGTNTDTIFTVKVIGNVTKITHIPRDSYILSRRFGPLKLNGLLVRGGPQLVEEKLSNLMGRQIRNHLIVSLDSIKAFADKLGPIEVQVPNRMYYSDQSQDLLIDLQPGLQVLDGNELEGFLRWRNDDQGDFGRIERQYLFLNLISKWLRQPRNLIYLPSLINNAKSYLETDLDKIQLLRFLLYVASSKLQAETLESIPFYSGGVSYLNIKWPGRFSDQEIE